MKDDYIRQEKRDLKKRVGRFTGILSMIEGSLQH